MMQCKHGEALAPAPRQRQAITLDRAGPLVHSAAKRPDFLSGSTMPDDAALQDPIIEAVRRFVREICVPAEEAMALTDEPPAGVREAMAELGIFGLSIPEAHGGLGLSMEQEVRVAFELGWTSPAFRSMAGTNIGIGSQGLVMFGTPEQKARFLPGIASGDIVTSFALTETEAGSDAGALRTRARRDGDDWVLDGAKCYITNADKAHLFTVMARTGSAEEGGRGVTAFLVPGDAAGLSIGKSERKMGQQGAHIGDVILDGVRVPDAMRLGAVGEGFKVAMQVLDRGRLHIAAVCVGAAQRITHEALGHAMTRRQFGKPLIDHQMVAAQLADCRAETIAARAMVLEAARLRDAGGAITLEASAAKLFASEAVGRIADRAVQIFGGAGYVAGVAERFYRDVRIFRIYEGTSEIQRLVIAREMAREVR
jgi:acyl-CoA dehydrogenase